jgi:hypothetical protein
MEEGTRSCAGKRDGGRGARSLGGLAVSLRAASVYFSCLFSAARAILGQNSISRGANRFGCVRHLDRNRVQEKCSLCGKNKISHQVRAENTAENIPT